MVKCDGASGQLQSTKLMSRHFDKNAYSCINVKLASQLLSQSLSRWFVAQYPMRVQCPPHRCVDDWAVTHVVGLHVVLTIP